MISNKLIAYFNDVNADKSSVYYKKGKWLNKLLQDSDNYSPLNTEIDKKDFTIKETKFGKEVFDVAVEVFGHFTIRAILTNMVTYYGTEGDFGVLFNNLPSLEDVNYAKKTAPAYGIHLVDIIKRTGLNPSTHNRDSPPSRLRGPKSIRQLELIFGMLFLESYIYLPIKGNNKVITEDYNTLVFPTGPLIILDGQSVIHGKSFKNVFWSIASSFKRNFEYIKYGLKELAQTFKSSHKK